MTDRVHPGGFIPLKIWINNGDPVVNLLERESVLGGRENCLADKGGIGKLRFSLRIRTGRKLVG